MRWIAKLGGCEQFDLVICSDAGTPFNQVIDLKTLAEKAFKSATIISTDKPELGWPTASNAQWLRSAKWAKENSRAWLWLEPDCVPIRKEWLTEISEQYEQLHWTGKKYLGHSYHCRHSTL